MPCHHDAASSKYQNNVSNTNYYNLNSFCCLVYFWVQIYDKYSFITLFLVTNTFSFALITHLKALLNSSTLIRTGSTMNSGRL